MWNMVIDIPETDELLGLSTPAAYGDMVVAGREQSDRGAYADAPEERGDFPVMPRPGGGALHLSSVLPALSSSIGNPVATAVHHDPALVQRALGLPDASSAIVVLIDGLGFWNLVMRLGHTPYLRSLLSEHANQRPIRTCSPSTTVAAMATFGTGTCPGLTGMTGYTQRNPHTGQICQLIQFKQAPDPLDLQRQPTVFETLTQRGVRVTSCGLPKFAHSPLTQAALRGAQYVSGGSPRARVMDAARSADTPGLTYLYIRDADKVGHAYGWDSERWIGTFEGIDAQLRTLHQAAPKGTLIVIVADHGMISVDPEQRVDIAQDPRLIDGVELVGGEPRATMLYAMPNRDPDEIATRWRTIVGDTALVMTRQQAFDEGMFGPIDPRVGPMIGDVLVYAKEQSTFVDSRTQSDAATRLPSVHGSLSRIETEIPCLVDLV